MKKHPILFLLIILQFSLIRSQNIDLRISARVDTTIVAHKKIYHLYKNYLNAKKDNLNESLFWAQQDVEKSLEFKKEHINNADEMMFSGYSPKDFLGYYSPIILQIDRINEDRYQIKTIFSKNCVEIGKEKYNPDSITKLYVVKDKNGNFKLENTRIYDTRNWKKYNYKFIKYIVHPSVNFNKKEAKQAIKFCKNLIKEFGLSEIPFTYYLTSNSDDMLRLFNFEYILSYSTGRTYIAEKEIYTSHSNANYPHEFVHLLFPKTKHVRPMIINEGLATWLGGPSYDESFENGLLKFSLEIKNKAVTLNDIIENKYRNPFDNNPIYLSGGVICKLIYEKHGVAGIWEIYNADTNNYKQVLEKLFGISYSEIDKLIINYIKNYSKN